MSQGSVKGEYDAGAVGIDADRADRMEQLVVGHVGDVAAYCRWRCASEDDAQDAVSDVFLIAWRRLGDVPEGDAGRVWLLATARRVIANERRARGRRHRLVERLRLAEPSERVQWPVDLAPGEVADALSQLDSADREILLLAEWEGLTSTEIGAVIGCLAVTARGRLHRARERFRRLYQDVTSSTEYSHPPNGVFSRPDGPLDRQATTEGPLKWNPR